MFPNKEKDNYIYTYIYIYIFYLDFLSQTLTNYRIAGAGGGHFFNFSLPLPRTSQALRH